MPIVIKDVYEQAFQAQRHASDFRAKIIGGWAAMYTAFAGAFVWVQVNEKALVWFVLCAAVAMTLMMWGADHRNRAAIKRAKEIGEALENDPAAGIPEQWRFFNALDQGIPHGVIIDIFAIASLAILAVATLFFR